MTVHKCDWCNKEAQCYRCPEGAYHMHNQCYTEAVRAGYFDSLDASKQQIPVSCHVGVFHFVLGYREQVVRAFDTVVSVNT